MARSKRDISKPWRLRCERLCVTRGGRRVLAGVDLEIGEGECLSLIGPNGSGKTTLMLTMLGLLKPESGSARINGAAICELPADVRGRFAAYVPQTVERIPAYSIREVVAAGRFPHVSPARPLSRVDWEHVDQALAMCGLTELADRRLDSVSGGERQKALIAAAAAQDAQILFLDEPNTALDPAYQIELIGMLRSWREKGRALALISHDLQLPAALGGRAAALCDGEIAADGRVEEILRPARLGEIFGAEFETARTAGGREVALPNWSSATSSKM